MITLVNGKGEQVNNFQFLDWEGAENCLREQRESGKDGVYLRGDFGTPILYDGIYYIAVEFGDYTGMVIKAKRVPCPDELMIWIKPDMEQAAIPSLLPTMLPMKMMFTRATTPRISTTGLFLEHSSVTQGDRKRSPFFVSAMPNFWQAC